jgi:hypothetical protein
MITIAPVEDTFTKVRLSSTLATSEVLYTPYQKSSIATHMAMVKATGMVTVIKNVNPCP